MIVFVCTAFGLTVSEAKTKIMFLRPKGRPESTTIFSVKASRQVYNQMNELVYLGGNVNQNDDLSIESTGAYATHDAAFRSTPSNCTTDQPLPSTSNSGC